MIYYKEINNDWILKYSSYLLMMHITFYLFFLPSFFSCHPCCFRSMVQSMPLYAWINGCDELTRHLSALAMVIPKRVNSLFHLYWMVHTSYGILNKHYYSLGCILDSLSLMPSSRSSWASILKVNACVDSGSKSWRKGEKNVITLINVF